MNFNLNRGASTLIIVFVIIVLLALISLGVFLYDKYLYSPEKESISYQEKESETDIIDIGNEENLEENNQDSLMPPENLIEIEFDLDKEIQRCQSLPEYGEGSSSECFTMLMFAAEDKKICQFVSARHELLCSAINEKKPELCAQVGDPGEQAFCKVLSEGNIAELFPKSKNDCNVYNGNEKNECLIIVALSNNSSLVCQDLSEDRKEFCLAITENNSKKCNGINLITDLVNKDICLAVVNNNINYCDSPTIDFYKNNPKECKSMFVFIDSFINRNVRSCYSLGDLNEEMNCVGSVLGGLSQIIIANLEE
jgi:hypothetical protein